MTRSRILMRISLGIISIVGTVLLADVACAQENEGRPGGRGVGPNGSALFVTLDTDHDGSLSAAEITSVPASWQLLDLNGDGRIMAEELPRMMGRGGREGFPGFGRGGPGGRGGRGDEPGETRPTSAEDLVSALMAFDANKDGRLTRADVPERFSGLFDRADGNKDGQLTQNELKRSAMEHPRRSDGWIGTATGA